MNPDDFLETATDCVDELAASILNLVNVGVPTVDPPARRPSRREQAATDRADGRFWPTPVSPHVHTGTGDPTAAAVEQWERAVQHAVTGLASVMSGWAHLVALPSEPPTVVDGHGRTVIAVDPGSCRRWTVQAHGSLRELAAVLAERLRTWHDEGRAAGDAATLLDDLRRELRRHGRQRRACACGCGLDAPEVGKGAERASCRKRNQRERDRARAVVRPVRPAGSANRGGAADA